MEEEGCGSCAGQLGGEGGQDGQFPIDPFCHFCSSSFKVLSTKKKLNNHIVEIQKDATSWFICHLRPSPVCQISATTVVRTFQESPACLNTCWWSMEPAVPQKYCKTDIWSSWWHAPQDSDKTRGGRKQGDQMTGDSEGISLPSRGPRPGYTSAPQDSDKTRGGRSRGTRWLETMRGLVFHPEGPGLVTPVRHRITEDTSTR